MDNIKVGDKVLVKAEIVGIQENFPGGKYEVSVASFDYQNIVEQRRIYVNNVSTRSYEDGLNASWEMARKIINSAERGGFSGAQLAEIFGCSDCDIAFSYSAAEASAKIAEWEFEKDFHAGDVVKVSNGKNGTAIVTYTDKDGIFYVLWDDGSCGKYGKDGFVKTGRTIDIAGLLTQIGGIEQ